MRNRLNPVESAVTPNGNRVISKQNEMRARRLNLNRLIVQTSSALEQLLGRDIALQISCDQDLPPVLAVTNMVRNGLMDLGEAARAAMHGYGRATLGAAVKVVDDKRAGRFLESKSAQFVCISMRFNNDHADQDSSEALANVYAIAQHHCGWLEVCRDNEGTASFDLYLPVATAAEGTTFVGDRNVEIPGGHETILLVEDELDLLTLTRDILERFGYRIITAANGIAALKLWREHRNDIDLLLTDIRMPEGISGHELAERLLFDKPTLKVVYVTGYSVESYGIHRLEMNPNFVTKPFTPPGLALTVRRALDSQVPAQVA